jgi:hypothetical protein
MKRRDNFGYTGAGRRIILKCDLRPGWKGMKLIHPSQEVVQWRASVNVLVFETS